MTDLATGVGADAPAPYALERSVPADTPAYLSTHDAAAMLRKLRQPKNEQTPPATERATSAASEEGTKSTASVAAETAAQTPPGQTEGADRQEQPAPIEPPRSWTKEDKELFATLPRETQERLAERERARDSDFSQRQQKATEQAKALEAERQKVEQARQAYEAALPQLLQNLVHQQVGEFVDLIDHKSGRWDQQKLDQLAREDWPRYLQWQRANEKTLLAANELQAAQQRQVQEMFTQFADFAKREDNLFKEKVPDMADEAKAAELQTKALTVLRDLGFDEEKELMPMWNGQKELSLRDHRLQLLIRDATLWREAEKKAKAAATKPVPPVQRPGAATARQGTDEARVQHLTQRLEQTGSLRDAAALVRARRTAAR